MTLFTQSCAQKQKGDPQQKNETQREDISRPKAEGKISKKKEPLTSSPKSSATKSTPLQQTAKKTNPHQQKEMVDHTSDWGYRDHPIENDLPDAANQQNNPFLFPSKDSLEYIIGEGDVITVHAWGQPEISGSFNIGPDGKFTLPLIGVVKLSGLSRSQSGNLLTDKLEKLYPGASVRVGVSDYTSHQITVLGQIRTPGVVQMEKSPRLLDVIARAGGIPDQDRDKLGGCTVIRANNSMAWVDLEALLNQGNLSLNLHLKKGDYVYIPKWREKRYYVLGEVQSPGTYPWKKGLTVLDALTFAGSYTDDAVLTKVQLIRTVNGVKKVLNIKDLLKLENPQLPVVEEGDIVFVPPNWISKVSYVLSRLNPLSWYFFTTGRSTVPGAEPDTRRLIR